MSTHKHIDKICLAAAILAILISSVFLNGEALGIQAASTTMGYESRLFDTSRVHTIDIVMDDWDSFIETCENEEYAVCSVVIDGDAYKNVGIRAKGNTSLSTVSSMNSDRYSFKIEFDQYDSTMSYYGLDKLCLNNLIQDSTYMKDFLTYQMMGEFGVDAPLCSYVYITVNGEDWGLYLAVEAIEDAFLQRNYGSSYGDLYKPDSQSMGGGRGNGRDFNMEDFIDRSDESVAEDETVSGGSPRQNGRGKESDDFDFTSARGGGDMGGMGSMSSSDVMLQYIDDDPDSYSNIFSNAKTDPTEVDRARLIEALKALSAGENIEKVVTVDEVIRYFVVHNFVVNGDSYTGSMIHNYYLYEKNGQLSMIPWDYNLAFGTFQGSSASSAVNDPIDTPLSVTGSGDRPMIDWILSSEEYIQLYHQYFAEFLASVDFISLIDATKDLIAPYVEKDPTQFYSYEEFETGAATLREFCLLRAESIQGQLDGSIPSTSAGQSEDSSALIDASHITLSDMGSMNNDAGGKFGGGGTENSSPVGGFDGRGDPMGDFPGETGTVDFPDGQTDLPAGQTGEDLSGPPEQGEMITAPERQFFDREETARGPSQDETDRQFSAMAQPSDKIQLSDTMPGQVPDSAGENFPAADFPGGLSNAEPSAGQGVGSLILLAVSAIVLFAGLLIAFKFHR